MSGAVELGRSVGMLAGPAPGVYAMMGGGAAVEGGPAAGGIGVDADEYNALKGRALVGAGSEG